jgi:hypothetical protein
VFEVVGEIDEDDDDYGQQLIPDNLDRYFWAALKFSVPSQTLTGFEDDSVMTVTCSIDPRAYDHIIFQPHITNPIIVAEVPVEERKPSFETTVTLVNCDRWVDQETNTMFRREQRSTL